ncbi:hypothetical protein BJ878DRAFT_559527 [Calycina marina]|uniref:Uncharacterized protein n=1 Tax=Calycina marina TaxID=1763456 RepID=A0A9P7YVT6_9HELO|nr:hypothetical protein BJ878DRAFT_559527 [Calycina marina]
MVATDPNITLRLVTIMRRELRALDSLRVHVVDVRWDNYKGGHLLDFSSSWTVPYFQFRRDTNEDENLRMNRELDFVAFDKMAEEEYEEN